MKLKKGDTVIVLTGKDKGKTGKIEKVMPEEQSVIVSGVNMYKRHRKPRSQQDQGGIIDKTLPIHASKVAFYDAKTKKPSRLGYQVTKGEKVRISKKSGQIV